MSGKKGPKTPKPPPTSGASTSGALSTGLKVVDPTDFEIEEVDQSQVEKMVFEKTIVPIFEVKPAPIDEILAALPSEVKELGDKGRGMIFGVNAVRVYKAFLTSLIAARQAGNPMPLIYMGVLSVAVAYTVSREWVEEYAIVPGTHMMSQFEIEGRKKVPKIGDKDAVTWIEDSDMNASALRVFGSMIVEAGESQEFFKSLKEQAGTMFTPPKGASERDQLMIEASKEVSDPDREALKAFSSFAGKYCLLIGAIFGGTGGSFIAYEEAAKILGEVVI